VGVPKNGKKPYGKHTFVVASILLHFTTRPIHVYWPSGKMQQIASYNKGQQVVRRHDNGDGRHDYGKRQQGGMRHDNGDGRYGEGKGVTGSDVSQFSVRYEYLLLARPAKARR